MGVKVPASTERASRVDTPEMSSAAKPSAAAMPPMFTPAAPMSSRLSDPL